jgi:hypothetical protein
MRISRLMTCAVVALLLYGGPAYAQGGGTTASLSGVVTDAQGGVIPGASVVVTNNATAGQFTAVTTFEGRFTFPAMQPGTYTVTVTLDGFKTAVLPDVQIVTATPATVNVKLELGDLTETVTVEGATALVQTQTAAVQRTVNVQQISSLPLVTRTALDFVTALPGALTTGSNSRGTTINGLPSGSINITLDGVNVQDNANRNDGFFMYIRPLMDSVEEITVSSATPGAESAGSGSVQIRMTTRSGSSRFSGSVYNTWRNQAGTNSDDVMNRNERRGWLWRLNTPYWFNKRDRPKTAAGDHFIDDVRLQTPGFRVGGPAITDKLFYFYNHEWFLWPNQVARTRYLPNDAARMGVFGYTDNAGVARTIDLLALAAANGQLATMDPITQKLFADMRSAVTGFTGGAVSSWDHNTDKFDYSPGGDQKRHFPTGRIDYNMTSNHRITGTVRYNRFESSPDILNSREPRFPGFANVGGQYSHRYSWTGTLRSTFGQNLVNEAKYGFMGGTTQFFTDVTRASFDCDGPGCTGGWNLANTNNSNLLQIGGGGNQITGPQSTNAPSTRYTPATNIENTLTWLRGRHTVSTGASFARYYAENMNVSQLAPVVTFGMVTTDPAYSILSNSANYPGGLNTTQQAYARNLYAMLTGRVSSVGGSFVLDGSGNYEYLGRRIQEMSYNDIGLFVQDAWRWKPTVTLTAGLRWQLQMPFQPDADSYTQLQDYRQVYGITGEGNLFKPGTMTGSAPQLVQYAKGGKAYNTDWNNFAPSLGVVWQPALGDNLLSRILSREPVFRGGYSMSYEAPGFGGFTNIFGNNPGATRSATRSIALGNLGTDGLGLPVLLRQPSRLGPEAAPIPSYPFTPAVSDSVRTFHPDTRTSYTHSYSVGWQRQLGRNTAVEVQYIGNQNIGQTFEWNMNATANWSIYENGFYDEFRRAQGNLRANIAAGNGNTFAFTGAPGTAPLPIFMAFFHGVPLADARNQNPASYTHANFRNSAWYNPMAIYNPNITGVAGTGTSGLQNPSFYANAAAAGLPANFFMANPASYAGGSFMRMNGGRTKYDSVQLELRRRLSQGFHVQTSYVKGVRNTWDWASLRESTWHSIPSAVGPDHAIKVNGGYELPFGRGKRLGGNASRLTDAFIGGWEVVAVGRYQSGPKFNIGGLTLVGMTAKDVQDMFKFYRRPDASGKERIYMFPEDVILNSILAFSTNSATSLTGYSGALPTGRYFTRRSNLDCVAYLTGDCGVPESVLITAPWYGRTDFAFVKRFKMGSSRSIEARMDLYNILNSINFTPVGVSTGSSPASWEVTTAARDLNASQDAGGRITSFGLRFSW